MALDGIVLFNDVLIAFIYGYMAYDPIVYLFCNWEGVFLVLVLIFLFLFNEMYFLVWL